METYHLRVVIHANSVLGCSEMDSGDFNISKKIHTISVLIFHCSWWEIMQKSGFGM